ncbi:hypothetical protein AOZ06_15410 [Kibdelosporangium phytohabitans]|uniref:Uncharacterized protein n=1 Tax=Kibdelosporangium phytohabitans TaxID=860235 RepID=A0A0N9HXH3_9PSEU|nr:hypothetical protein [Kibdelosporangium phytohabitans]ALG08117.1 hypothetical protein AOZ06_15410 [Kibdelosporangium phytohabitans]
MVQLNSEGSWRPPVPGPPPDPAEVTTAAIDAALAGLEGLDQLEPVEHVGRFDAVHTALTEALSSIDKV